MRRGPVSKFRRFKQLMITPGLIVTFLGLVWVVHAEMRHKCHRTHHTGPAPYLATR